MSRTIFLIALFFYTIIKYHSCSAQNFKNKVVIKGLDSPWEITYGPDDSLWVTESVNYLVKKINTENGGSKVILDLSGEKNFFPGKGSWPQGGLMGMAIHPALYSEDPDVRKAKPWVYLAYVYERTPDLNSKKGESDQSKYFKTKIVRYDYKNGALIYPKVILDNIPGSNDHNSGRLKISPVPEYIEKDKSSQYRLYYTIGDMGAGQFNNKERYNNAQDINIMEGKIIRLNTEQDQDIGLEAWIPDDNPFNIDSAVYIKDYVYSYGHRNAQGIVWGNVDGNFLLYSAEHGPQSDDEINIIKAGGNFGWNRIAGFIDNNYNGLKLGGYGPVNEKKFKEETIEPIYTMYTISRDSIDKLGEKYHDWPGIAPSSVEFYSYETIPGWKNSLLVSSLKAGKIFRLKLNDAGNGIAKINDKEDVSIFFKGLGRFRDIAISPDGRKIYVSCDKRGHHYMKNNKMNKENHPPENAGAILEFTYIP